MKAKDTVLYHLNCEICGGDFYNTEAFPNPHYCSQCLKARRAGIKEVVDWIEDNRTPFLPDGKWDNKKAVKCELQLLEGEWQAKLKEWDV